MIPELKEFVDVQEHLLRKNNYKYPWYLLGDDVLFSKLLKNVSELHELLLHREDPLYSNDDEIKETCADIANYAMMIFDKINEGTF